MKELSVEEKVKRYDEAIKVAADIKAGTATYITDGTPVIDAIFPELKESEDESIRKYLSSFVELNSGVNLPPEEAKKILAWLEKQSTPQVRTGLEWVNTIDDACEKRYSEEYAHGEYCHEQSFKWGFQEGVDWLEKQGEQKQELLTKEKALKNSPFVE